MLGHMEVMAKDLESCVCLANTPIIFKVRPATERPVNLLQFYYRNKLFIFITWFSFLWPKVAKSLWIL